MPEVGVGTQYFFDRLDAQLAPEFDTSMATNDENCRNPYEGCEPLQSPPNAEVRPAVST